MPARALRLFVSLLVVFSAVVSGIPMQLPIASAAASSPTGDTPGAWPTTFSSYRFADGTPVMDVENDINPGQHDIGSNVLTEASTLLANDGTNIFFQVRTAYSPMDLSKGGFASGTIIVQVATEDSPGVWTTKGVVGLNGKNGGAAADPDFVYVAQAPGTGVVQIYNFTNVFDPGGAVGSGARVMCTNGTIPTSGTCPVGTQYLLDFQVPLARLTAASSGQITAATPVRLFYGTSAANNLATINKDFMTGSAVSFDNLSTVKLTPATIVLTESKTHVSGPNPPTALQASVYDINLSAINDGSQDLNSATVTTTIPAGVTIVSSSTASGTISAVGQTVTWTIGLLPYGYAAKTATIRVSTTPTIPQVGGTVTLANAATGTGTDAISGATRNGSGTAQTAGPVGAPSIIGSTTSVNCGSGPFTYGSTVACTVTVANSGVGGAPTGDVDLSASAGTLSAAVCTLVPGTTSSTCSVNYTPTSTGSGLVSASYDGDATHTASSGSTGTLTINAAPLTVTANDATRDYGEANPTLDATISGFVAGDDASDLGGSLSCSTTATSSSPADDYAISCSGLTSSNYDITFVAGTLSVGTATLTVSADNASRQYGEANPTFTATITGFAAGDDASDLGGALSCSTSATASSAVGDYDITCSGLTSTNYTINYADGALTIDAATLTVTADDTTRTYGDANPTLTATITGFVAGDDAGDLGGTLNCTSSATAADGVGSYGISCSGLTSSNYTINYVDGALTVTKRSLTVTVDPATMTYGDPEPAYSVSFAGFVNGDDDSVISGSADCSSDAGVAPSVGEYSISCDAAGLDAANYDFGSPAPGTLIIEPAVLTVVGDGASKVYGEANPTFSASYYGFVAGDDESDLSGTLTLSTDAVSNSPVGFYTVLPAGVTSANYQLVFVGGLLSVTPATLTVTADDASKTYGDANPALSAAITGFVAGDDASVLSGSAACSTSATSTSDAGLYAITCAAGTLASDNYDFAFVDGSLSVTPAALTITVNDESKTYGAANPGFSLSYDGFVAGDSALDLDGSSFGYSTSATTASPVGDYAVGASGLSNPNYDITFVDGTLSITPASLTVTADDASRALGQPNPTFTATFDGLVAGDTAADLIGTLSFTTAAVEASPVGDYSVTPSGVSSSNYDVTFVDGTLSVTPATITVTADDASRTYGDANPSLTATLTGFLNGDDASDLGGTLTCTTAASTTSDVGDYAITCSGLTSGDYEFVYVDGSLTVDPATLTITALDAQRAYGEENPDFTTTITGFVAGDSADDFAWSVYYDVWPADSAFVAPGTYPLIPVPSGFGTNYQAITYYGTLTVTPAPLTVTVNDATKTYGAANPGFSLDYSGFLGTDGPADLDASSFAYSTSAATDSGVGDYEVSVSGLTSPNYDITFIDGTLSITPAALTITADDASVMRGSFESTWGLTATFEGLVAGDTEADLNGSLALTSSATPTSDVGTYPISASGLSSDNYDITYVDGTLRVDPAVLQVWADVVTKTYGDPNPTLGASFSGFIGDDDESDLGGTLECATLTPTDASSNVGYYDVACSGLISDQYEFDYQQGALYIDPAALTVTADDASKTYGDGNPTFTASISGFVNGDDDSDLGGTLLLSTAADDESGAGTYSISASGLTSGNYDITFVDGTLSVTPAELTVSIDDTSKTYGDANPVFHISITGFVAGDSAMDLNGSGLSISPAADASSPVGDYPVSISGFTSPNYDITFIDGTLTIEPAPLTLTVDDISKTYGDPNPPFSVTITGFVNGDDESDLAGTLAFATGADEASPVGSYAVSASGLSSANYDITFVGGSLTVTAPTITVTADNSTRAYGDANPSLTATLTGFVNGDDASDLGGSLTCSTTATSASDIGDYVISCSGLTSGSYLFDYVDGTLSVTPAAMTVTADDATKTYGDANPTLTASISGFVAGDDAGDLGGSLSFDTSATSSSDVGSYTITASGLTSSNYNITYIDGSLSVTPAPLTVTVDDASKAYGEANPDVSLSFAGFVNGNDASDLDGSAFAVSTSADESSPVGDYAFAISGLANPNYDITFVAGTLSVTPAALTVTADNASKTYGDVNPTFTATITGFVAGDGESDLSGTLACSTIATGGSSAGVYAISCSGLASPNYDITFIDGGLTVQRASLTVTIDDETKTYGDANPTFSVTIDGFVNSDDDSFLDGTPVFDTSATTSSAAGDYAVSVSGLSSDNYDITFVDGTLSVLPAPLTISTDFAIKIYGDANPTFSASYTGFVNGDDASDLDGTLSFDTAATASSDAGAYAVTASGLSSANYDITYEDGTLFIVAKLLYGTVDNVSKTYGDTNPSFSVSFDGFVNGDDASDLDGTLAFSTSADASSPVGAYAVSAGGLSSTNYIVVIGDGTLSVGPADLNISVDDAAKTYGETNPSFAVSYAGLVGDDTAADLNGTLAFTTSADANSGVGDYTVSASGLSSPNYAVSFTDGTLSVSPAGLTVEVDDVSKTYGDGNPTFTATITGFVAGDDASDLTGTLIFTTGADASSGVGDHSVSASGLASDNYDITYTDGTLSVEPAELTVTANDTTRQYGASDPTFEATFTGFVNGDDAADLTGTLVCSSDAGGSSVVGSYTVSCGGLAGDNYDITYVDGTFHITHAPQDIVVDLPTDVVFGDDPIDLPPTSDKGLPLIYSTDGGCKVVGGQLFFTAAGECEVTVSVDGDDRYSPDGPDSFTVNVGPATPVLDWDDPEAIRTSTALSATQLNAAATFGGTAVDGTYTYTPAVGQRLEAGERTLHVVFTPDSNNFVAVEGDVQIIVVPDVISLIGLKTEPVGEGEELTLTAHVEGCFQTCDFDWYVDGVFVGSSNSTLDSPVSITVVGADDTGYFTAFSEMTRTYTPGTHLVHVDAVDASGFTWQIEGTVEVIAKPAVPPTVPLLPDTALSPVQPARMPLELLGLLALLAAGYATCRRLARSRRALS